MSILLTGASGFIGQNLKSIKSERYRCVVRADSLANSDDQFVINDMDRHTEWAGAFNGCEAVIHLAGLAHSNSFSESDFQRVNVDGTLKLATAAAKSGVKRFVFVSSIGVNGAFSSDRIFSPFAEPHPHNVYAQSKLDAELALNKLSVETGLEVVIVRPTLVYGPNAPGNFGSLVRLVSKLPFLPFGLTSNKRDFISVQNLADLLLTCAKHPNAGGHIFLASDSEAVSIKKFTNEIAIGLGKNLIQLPVPVGLMRLVSKSLGKSAMVEQLVGNLEVDSSNLKEVLNWTPPYSMCESMAFLKQEV
jgi:nucleoside-diphosphate-sugar epimerase